MAVLRPLRLKSEVAKVRPGASTSTLPVARLWVDSGIYHLDQYFDYLIPDNLSSQVETGIRVQVPFHGREVEGIVVERTTESDSPILKSITKVLSPHSVATVESLALIDSVARRWAAHPFDVLRSAIPPRTASVDREVFDTTKSATSRGKLSRRYLHIPPYVDRFQFIKDEVVGRARRGSCLVLLPDSRSIQRLHDLLPESIVLDSSDNRSDRYRNFLKIRNGGSLIALGTRSAIFAPITDLASIVVVDEGSENHYEVRSPGWNTRDVAILRSLQSNISLTFIGYSPSSEVARLIETHWIEFATQRSRVNVSAFPQNNGELLPSRLVSEIRKRMKQGPILFLSPRKGYSQALSCAKCRNIALCSCGGRLTKGAAKSPIECVICSSVYPEWRCSWCQGANPFLINRGTDRFAFEIGATFPGVAITQSTSENLIDIYEKADGFVICTPGAAPLASQGYALVVILEGERFFSQADVRAHERSRDIFFATSALVSADGVVALVISADSPITGAISAWKPSLLSQRELREREEADLPPYSRAVTLDIPSSESQSLLRGLKKSQEDGRLPLSTKFLGPSRLAGEVDRIVLLVQLKDGEALIELLHEFQRRRSVAKKSLATIRIDPYSLSR